MSAGMTRPFRAPGDPKPKGPPVVVVLKPTLPIT